MRFAVCTLPILCLISCSDDRVLPAISGGGSACLDDEQDFNVCAWAQRGDAIVVGEVSSLSPSRVPIADDCVVAEEALAIDLNVVEVLWGDVQADSIRLAFGPSVTSGWIPSVSIDDDGIEWGQSNEGQSISIGQIIGARVTYLDDGRSVPSVLFSMDGDLLTFQEVLSECEADAPASLSKAGVVAELSDCPVVEVDTSRLLIGDAICHDEGE